METLEKHFFEQGKYNFGIDEAGRGPLAGPVVAAAVCLPETPLTNPIRDSKLMTARQRRAAFEEIIETSVYGVGIMSEAVIDEVNILNATFLAMRNAIEGALERLRQNETIFQDQDVFLLIDGNAFRTDLPYPYRTVVGGDKKVKSIAAASIVAKVIRDRILMTYDRVYPGYGFAKHKGYPTREHKDAIARCGFIDIHRRSFACR